MGVAAVNGRQVWNVLFSIKDGKSKLDKIFGLDFSPSKTNLLYLKENPETLKGLNYERHFLKDYGTVFMNNFNKLYTVRTGQLIGPFGVFFFAIGLMALFRKGYRYESFLILTFIPFNLIAPLIHDVKIRTISIISPLIMLTEGIGIVYVSRTLLEGSKKNLHLNTVLPVIIVFGLIGSSAYSLPGTFRPATFNIEYSHKELKRPIHIINSITEKELNRKPIVTAQRRHISYYSGAQHFYFPYTDLDKFITFCELNNIDFVYFRHRKLKSYPLYNAFVNNRPSQLFTLLYSGTDDYGKKIELFRFNRELEAALDH